MLPCLPPLPEDISGPGTRRPRHALSKAQTLGNIQLVMLCLAIANVVMCILLEIIQAKDGLKKVKIMHIDYPGVQDEEDGDYKLEKELEDLFVGGAFV